MYEGHKLYNKRFFKQNTDIIKKYGFISANCREPVKIAQHTIIYQNEEFIYGNIVMPKFIKTEAISKKDAINTALKDKLSDMSEHADVVLTYAKDKNDNLSVAAGVMTNGEFQLIHLQ